MERLATSAAVPAIEVTGLSFAYPAAGGAAATPVLDGVSLQVAQGEFCLLCGRTGSGKTTLLRLMKPEVSPAGERAGEVRVLGRDVTGLSVGESAALIGYVAQSPESQIVCDSVWHEVAFGLESVGSEQPEMRRRIAEACHFLGIERLFRRRTAELSGGERQLVALAGALVMEPEVMLLDEPTALLDPVARDDFAHALFRLNRELGITVVVATHEPWTLAAYATSAVRVGEGALAPVALDEVAEAPAPAHLPRQTAPGGAVVTAADVWQRYDREAPWVLRGLSLEVAAGEAHALLGGNGSGKTTLLRAVAGTVPVRRGRLDNVLHGSQAYLPQAPEALLGAEDVRSELMEWSSSGRYGEAEALALADRLGLGGLLARDPLDLSRGQRQLVALAKVLLPRPALVLADEPTSGLDADVRAVVHALVREMCDAGTTFVIATHDLALARAVCDRCSLLFDGSIACTMPTGRFFVRNVLFR